MKKAIQKNKSVIYWMVLYNNCNNFEVLCEEFNILFIFRIYHSYIKCNV